MKQSSAQAKVAIFVAPPSSEVGSGSGKESKLKLELSDIAEATPSSHIVTQVIICSIFNMTHEVLHYEV